MNIKNITLSLAMAFSVATPALAVVDVYVFENGADTQIAFEGTLDITGLSGITTNTGEAALARSFNQTDSNFNILGSLNGSTTMYSVASTNDFSAFGNSSTEMGSYVSGDPFYFATSNGEIDLWVADGYVSGSQLKGTYLFASTLIADLDLTSGFTGNIAKWATDSINLHVGFMPQNFFGDANGPATAVPVPASLPLLLGSMGILGFMRKRKA